MKRARQRRMAREKAVQEAQRDLSIQALAQQLHALEEKVSALPRDIPAPVVNVETQEVIAEQKTVDLSATENRIEAVYDRMNDLQRAIEGIDVKPEFEVIVPEIEVPTPEVNVPAVETKEAPAPKSYKVERNDMGFVERVIPEF